MASTQHISVSARGSFSDYISLARLDHSTKHVFIIPGVILALAIHGSSHDAIASSIAVGFLSAIAIASGNYVINEWLDRSFDAFHPEKSSRPSVHRNLSPLLVYLEYVAFVTVGLVLAVSLGTNFFVTSLLFVVSGLVYNVRPLRTKDLPYFDVISESINNPIRLTLGWTMIDPQTLPPVSLLLAFWAGGAFLMAAKRLSEYREIASQNRVEVLCLYRRSFRYYTADNLTVSCLLYAVLAAFFLAIFLIKYRVEYIVAFPFLSCLFAMYFWLSLRAGSVAQRPERLFRSRRLVAVSAAAVAALLLASFIDMPFLSYVTEPGFVVRPGFVRD